MDKYQRNSRGGEATRDLNLIYLINITTTTKKNTGGEGWQKEKKIQEGLHVEDHFAMEVKVNYEEWLWAI